MRKLTKEEYQHVKDWMRKHENADELVFDTVNNLPLKAIYNCPLGSFEQEKRKDILEIMEKLDETIDKMEAI